MAKREDSCSHLRHDFHLEEQVQGAEAESKNRLFEGIDNELEPFVEGTGDSCGIGDRPTFVLAAQPQVSPRHHQDVLRRQNQR